MTERPAHRPYPNVRRAAKTKSERWEARLPRAAHKGGERYLGTFATPEDARRAVLTAQAAVMEKEVAKLRAEAVRMGVRQPESKYEVVQSVRPWPDGPDLEVVALWYPTPDECLRVAIWGYDIVGDTQDMTPEQAALLGEALTTAYSLDHSTEV